MKDWGPESVPRGLDYDSVFQFGAACYERWISQHGGLSVDARQVAVI